MIFPKSEKNWLETSSSETYIVPGCPVCYRYCLLPVVFFNDLEPSGRMISNIFWEKEVAEIWPYDRMIWYHQFAVIDVAVIQSGLMAYATVTLLVLLLWLVHAFCHKLLPSTAHSSGTGMQGFIVNLGGDFKDMFFQLWHRIVCFKCGWNHQLVVCVLFLCFDILKCVWNWLPKQWQLSVVGFCPFVVSREWAINVARVSDDVDFLTFLPTGVGDTVLSRAN